MPSINQMKKKITDLEKAVKPKKSTNWKHNHPKWMYDIMFCDFLLYNHYSNKNPDELNEMGKALIDKGMGRPYNADDVEDALKYFEDNNIDPLSRDVFTGNYLSTFIMFVEDPEYYFNHNDVSDDLKKDWEKFIETRDFSIFYDRYENKNDED